MGTCACCLRKHRAPLRNSTDETQNDIPWKRDFPEGNSPCQHFPRPRLRHHPPCWSERVTLQPQAMRTKSSGSKDAEEGRAFSLQPRSVQRERRKEKMTHRSGRRGELFTGRTESLQRGRGPGLGTVSAILLFPQLAFGSAQRQHSK